MASTTKKTPPKSPGVVQNPGGGNDQAAVTALTNANAALAKAKASGNKSAIATAQKQAQSAAKTVQSRNQASTAAGLTQTGVTSTNKKTPTKSPGPSGSTAPTTGEQDQLTQLSTAVSSLSSSDSGDFATIQSDLAALAAQLSSDEQTLGNQQSELDALNNGSSTTTGTAGTTSTTSTTSGISSFLGSTTGKIALLGVLAVGGWFYLKNKKKTGGDGTAQ